MLLCSICIQFRLPSTCCYASKVVELLNRFQLSPPCPTARIQTLYHPTPCTYRAPPPITPTSPDLSTPQISDHLTTPTTTKSTRIANGSFGLKTHHRLDFNPAGKCGAKTDRGRTETRIRLTTTSQPPLMTSSPKTLMKPALFSPIPR